jgi:glycosyltransferase involved in cell wall biosynthesis
MKSVLFVHYAFELGGICNSLFAFLKHLEGNTDLSISLLILNGDKSKIDELPKNCELIETPRLIRCMFSDKETIIRNRSIIDAILYIFTRIISKTVGIENTARLLSKIAKIRRKYDIAVSFANDIYNSDGKCLKCGCNQYVADGINARVKIAWIHAFVDQIGYKDETAKRTYRKFDKIVNCNNTCKMRCDQLLPSISQKTVVVNNIVDEHSIEELSKITIDINRKVFNIVTFARIDISKKRIDRIPLIVEELLRRNRTGFVWHIIGDGKDLKLIQEMIIEKGISEYITLHGSMSNPYPFIKQSDLYVQTSDFEAMPMVILEARFLKTPIISTPYPAANEMIKGEFGLVTSKDISDITTAIEAVIDNKITFSWENYTLDGVKQLDELLLN